jgi:hypothetical protein
MRLPRFQRQSRGDRAASRGIPLDVEVTAERGDPVV